MRGCVNYGFASILVSVIIGDTLHNFGILLKYRERVPGFRSWLKYLLAAKLKPRYSALTLPVTFGPMPTSTLPWILELGTPL